jgi:exodeoxyribonuclease VII large subunit
MSDLFTRNESSTQLVFDEQPGSNAPAISVSELSNRLKKTVEETFGLVRVRGEISQPKLATSGHWYLTLKDQDAVLDAVCWRGAAQKLAVKPAEGIEVICTGRLTTFPGRSKYQMVIESMALAGQGALLKMLEDRKKQLAAEGLFDPAHKKGLPFLPRVIGVVTSPTGAVIRDILHRLADRFPCHVLVWPVLVQGDNAAAQVTVAIDGFNAIKPGGAVPRPDLLIVARGGGSLEDLMAFNEESVVRAAARSQIPLIAAIGHETDTTLIDYAADCRAPTPTAAAEMAVPVRRDLWQRLKETQQRSDLAWSRRDERLMMHLRLLTQSLDQAARRWESISQKLDNVIERLERARQNFTRPRQHQLSLLASRLPSPQQHWRLKHQQAARWTEMLVMAIQRRPAQAQRDFTPLVIRFDALLRRDQHLARDVARLESLAQRLENISHHAVLARGYALIRDAQGVPVLRARELEAAQSVVIEFSDGKINAKVV